MARYYVVDDNDSNPGGCLATIFIVVIVLAVLAYFAMYALAIVLGIILLISLIIGTILTIRNYIVALRDSIVSYGYISKPSEWIIPNFAYKWVKVSLETIKCAWSYNIGNIKDLFGKLRYYRFLSFRKWIYLFSALSVLIFGSIVSVSIVLLDLCLIALAIALVIIALAVACVFFALVGLGISIGVSTKNYYTRIRESYYSSATILSAYITQSGYREFVQIIKNYFSESVTYVKDGFTTFKTLPLMSFMKWLKLGSSSMMFISGSLMFVIYATIHILTISVLFIFFKIVSIFHRN